MDHREQRVVVETDHYRITGTLRTPRDGYRSRLTDFLNAAERTFIALTDVQLEPRGGVGRREQRDYIAVSLSKIVLAMPANGNGDGQDNGA
jgi:hypothetical protein